MSTTDDQLRQLKAKRKEFRAKLTSSLKELQMAEADAACLKDNLKELIAAHYQFCAIQDEIDKLIIDESEKEEQEAYVDTINREVSAAQTNAETEISRLEEQAKTSQGMLEDANKLEDQVQPEDSASTAGSYGSAISRASARAAMLSVYAETLEERQCLELEELRIKQKREGLQLRIDMAAAQAEAATEVTKCKSSITLNASAPEFRSKKQILSSRPAEVVTVTNNELLHLNQESHDVKSDVVNDVNVVRSDNVNDVNVVRSDTTISTDRSELLEMLNAMSLPKAELIKFDGDPLQYWLFIRSFESNVERTTKDSISRLTRLIQYCTGDARSVVQSCLCMQPDVGYRRARELLKQRFGDDYAISQAWVKKVTEGSVIGSKEIVKLQEFSDSLNSCVDTLSAMGYIAEVSTQRVIVSIVARLPNYLRTRWVREVQKHRSKGVSSLNIHDLANFVTCAAQEANDPVYSALLSGSGVSEGGSKKPPSKRHGVSFSTSVHSPVKQGVKCGLCHGDHDLFGCNQFKGMKVADRRKYAADNKLCFNCLKAGHWSKDCKLERTCGIDDCKQKHTKFLHPLGPRPAAKDESKQGESRNEFKFKGTRLESSCSATTQGRSRLALPIVAVKVKTAGCDKPVQAYALLDSGSTTSFCTDALADCVRAVGKSESMVLNTIDRSGREVQTRCVSLAITDIGERETYKLNSVYTRAAIPCGKSHIALHDDVSQFPHLKGIDLPFVESDSVTLLIGQDNADLMIPLEVRKGPKRGMPYAIRTRLGWVLNGAIGSSCNDDTSVNFVDCRLDEQLERFWKVEGWEHLNGPERSLSLEDERTMSLWRESISQDSNDHYVLPIPFRSENLLPDSLPLAKKRLSSLRQRLLRDPLLYQKYVDNMNDLLQKGHAEEVTVDEPVRGPVWYLPHHPVVSPKKVRVVFDCAAQVDGVSLNSCVMQGPDMTNELFNVLLRFRLGAVAIQGDIEAMFHQVKVPAPDRDALRYLWWQDGNFDGPVKIYRMTSHLFGGTWSPACCGFALRYVSEKHGSSYGQLAAETVKRNFYVDDCLRAVENVQEAIKLVSDLKAMLAEGGFRITKFASNSEEVIQSIAVEDRAKGVKQFNFDSDNSFYEKALGLTWDLKGDSFTFQTKLKDKPSTRRGMLSSVSSLFDPLGFVTPFTVRGRMLVQELVRLKIGWDDPIPAHVQADWNTWLEEFPALSEFKVDRCILPTDSKEFQLHHFADASTKAYGCVSYLRVVRDSGQVISYLVMSRSRVAPMKELSIPRLELSAAALAVKMDSMLRRELELDIGQSVFWSDSMVVLGYIRNPMLRYHTFVANRVSAIHAGSKPEQWHYVPSESNPADVISRGLSAKQLNESYLWLHGPTFMVEPEDCWPSFQGASVVPTKEDPEVKKVHEVHLNTDSDVVDKFIQHHSSWFVLRKRVALLLRVKTWLRCKRAGKHCPEISSPVTASEIEAARIALVQYVQIKEFPSYLAGHSARKGSLSSLKPALNEDGLLVVGGRIAQGDFSDRVKHPVILPKWHHIVELIIREIHEKGHVGKEHLLATLREEYWIVRGRHAVRRVLSRCIVCKRFGAKPLVQQMAELPRCRLDAFNPPFTNVGIDLFGPFMVKRGRSLQKRYGCLFTCMTVRAVHLEVCHSLDTDSFIHSLHRFMSRRGCPKRIFCDNGTNLVGAEGQLKELLSLLDQNKIHGMMVGKGIEWHFNPPSASHMGGAWERLIRSVRKVLRPLLSEQTLEDEGLATLMCIVESIINSRPLTVVSDDPKDPKPLTPNDLLIPKGYSYSYPDGEFSPKDLYVKRRWRQVQHYANVFWHRWLREYLPSLQTRSKWQDLQTNVKINDIVLLCEESPRSQWPLARVIEVYPGNDGNVRKVKVRTRSTELVRPIGKLCMLEEAE